MSVHAPLLGCLWRYLEAAGHDPGDFISHRFFEPGETGRHPTRIAFANVDATLAEAAERLKTPNLGLLVTDQLLPAHFGALGHAFLASSSLRGALHRFQHYCRFFDSDLEVELLERDSSISVSFRTVPVSQHPHLLGTLQVSGLLRLSRMIFDGQLRPTATLLKQPRPRDLTPWQERLGDNIVFSSETDGLVFSVYDADRPLTSADSALAKINERYIEETLEELDKESIILQAREAIMHRLPSGRLSEAGLADDLRLSKRTLHRRLRDHGESFRTVLAQVRKEMAQHYIQCHDYSMTEITFLLGYRNTSAFSRAFRHWYGCSPTDLRESVT